MFSYSVYQVRNAITLIQSMLSYRQILPTTIAAMAAFVSAGFASAAAIQVDNFALIDHQGKFHEYDYYCRDAEVKGIVLFVQGNGCPLVRKRVPELKRLRGAFEDKGILFGMINANVQDEREDLAEEAEAYGIDMPILKDSAQLVARMLKFERTAEAFLIDTKTHEVVFRGPIDDRMSYQKERPEASAHYLKDAIQALLKGEKVEPAKVEAPGCRITMEDVAKAASKNAYSEHVAPILKQRCVQCHTKGGVGPFAMSNYKKVKGWSEMIGEMIFTKQMPPWHADPHIGTFSNDTGITDEEAQVVMAWLRDGSPRGEGPDPLEGYRPDQPEWILGTPDAVVDLPKQEIPAEGILEYRYLYIDSPFDRDVWIKAAEVSPGNLQVVHHVIVTSEDKQKEKKRDISGQWVSGYAPGTDPSGCPDGTGIFLPQGHRLKFEVHYTVSGRPETDVTRLGIHLLDEAPAREFKTGVVIHHKFRIPAHAAEYSQSHSTPIKRDILIHALNPHMHFRGKWMNFAVKYPDGREEPLLSVPNYNFNWQRTYHLTEPLSVPAGSELIVRNAWDNSAANLHNPDPTKTVGWGDQSFDEMFFATFTFVEDDQPKHASTQK